MFVVRAAMRRKIFSLQRSIRQGKTVDITPAYAILPPDVIEECHFAFPRLRFIYVIRNPLERAWSHAKMDACAAGLTPGSLSYA